MDNLISVIVPVYNVEKYLNECIDSILSQTYENFELLLIDDGSTDTSSEICKSYLEKDSRIRYFRKENGGLSDARNYGIERANGEYITFIDSDDYIEKTYLEVLVNEITSNQSDVAVVNYVRVDEKGVTSYDIVPGKDLILTGLEALKNIFYQNCISVSANAKLYKKEIFKDIKFPKGKLYEDISTIPFIFLKAKKIAYSSQVLYKYRIRSGSITESDFKEKDFQMIENTLVVLKYIEENDKTLIQSANSYLLSKSSTLLFLVEKSNHEKKIYYMNEAWKYIKQSRGFVLYDKRARRMNRLAAILSFFGKKIYIFIYQSMKKR